MNNLIKYKEENTDKLAKDTELYKKLLEECKKNIQNLKNKGNVIDYEHIQTKKYRIPKERILEIRDVHINIKLLNLINRIKKD